MVASLGDWRSLHWRSPILWIKISSDKMKQHLKGFCAALCDRYLMPTAIKVALIVGSILFVIDRGSVLVRGEMTKQRWGSISSK
ncbi:MAG: nitrate/nitrite transporter NrtS [Cyanobacteriota bacterium]|nr:nitrate/nitrite transporter NrtS [Cyanobacteriota bacterium]